MHSAIMNWRLANTERTGIEYSFGNIERITCGIVSPAG